MPQRVAKVDQEYAGRQVKVGEVFRVEPGDVGLLSVLGRIEDKDMQAESPAEYQTRDMGTLHAKRPYIRKAH